MLRISNLQVAGWVLCSTETVATQSWNQAITISALNGDNLHSLVEAMEERLCLVAAESRSQANDMRIA